MLITACSLGTAAVCACVAGYWRRQADAWERNAAKHQDGEASARMDLESEKLRCRSLERQVESEKKLRRDLVDMLDEKERALEGEKAKCAELCAMLQETRGMLDEEREKAAQLYEDYATERDAFAKFQAERQDFEAEREKLEKEKQIMVELNNIFRYDGSAVGQVDIYE